MAFNLMIKNGWIVDGTGYPRFFGDVAVSDGKIAEVGNIDRSATASRVVDADGLTVALGFIDVHTHFDAQVTWDPLLAFAVKVGTVVKSGVSHVRLRLSSAGGAE